MKSRGRHASPGRRLHWGHAAAGGALAGLLGVPFLVEWLDVATAAAVGIAACAVVGVITVGAVRH